MASLDNDHRNSTFADTCASAMVCRASTTSSLRVEANNARRVAESWPGDRRSARVLYRKLCRTLRSVPSFRRRWRYIRDSYSVQQLHGVRYLFERFPPFGCHARRNSLRASAMGTADSDRVSTPNRRSDECRSSYLVTRWRKRAFLQAGRPVHRQNQTAATCVCWPR